MIFVYNIYILFNNKSLIILNSQYHFLFRLEGENRS